MIRTATISLIGFCLCSGLALNQPAYAADATIAPESASTARHNVSFVMQGLAPNASGGFTLHAVRLSYTPDSLNDPEATAILHHRIEAAAEKICRYNGILKQTEIHREVTDCQSRSISETLASLNIPK